MLLVHLLPVREIAEKSFAFRSTRHHIDRLEQRRESIVRSLNERAETNDQTVTIDDFRGYERLSSVMQRLQTLTPASRAEHRYAWLRQNVLPGTRREPGSKRQSGSSSFSMQPAKK